MPRIVAGLAKNHRLLVPKSGTRPSSDLLRESVFNILEQELTLDKLKVLDLFAGSGALGFEALSRGAASLDAVELSAGAVAVIKSNWEKLALSLPKTTSFRVHKSNAVTFLNNTDSDWELIFADPPYDFSAKALNQLLELMLEKLSAKGLAVLELASRTEGIQLPETAELVRDKRYGESRILIFGHPLED